MFTFDESTNIIHLSNIAKQINQNAMTRATKQLRVEHESRNEQKTPIFIFVKHMIDEVTQINASRIERYVTQYCSIASEQDCNTIRTMFQDKIKSI